MWETQYSIDKQFIVTHYSSARKKETYFELFIYSSILNIF